MNWYKRIIKFCQSITEQKPNYLEVGHIEGKKPNYIWYYIDGRLKIKQVNDDIKGHGDLNEYLMMGAADYLYSGRYESDTGYLSLAKPATGMQQFRDVPSRLISQLYQAFPDITQIFIY